VREWSDASVCLSAGKLVDEIVKSAVDDRSQLDMLGSRYMTSSESVFLWQVAVGLSVEPASAVLSAMHRSALHSGKTISFVVCCCCC